MKITPYTKVSTMTDMMIVSRIVNWRTSLMLADLVQVKFTHETMTQSMVITPAAMIAPTESQVPMNLDWSPDATEKVMIAHKPVKALRQRTPILMSRDITVSCLSEDW
jgi:hypothetical protein